MLQEFCDSLVVLDTETSGLDFDHDEIIEFAAIRLEWKNGVWTPVNEIDEFIRRKDDRKLPPKIVELTGITDEMLREEGVSKTSICERMQEFFRPRTMIAAYNAQFDLLFLYHLLAAYGDPKLLAGQPKLDLLTVYRDRRAYPHRLASAITAYGLDDKVSNSHRAIDDVRATVAVMEAMQKERDDLERYIDLFGYSQKYGVSGQRIRSVQYLPQGTSGEGRLYEALTLSKP